MAASTAVLTAETEILHLERKALERWAKGDPDGFLEICDPDVVYFDPFQEKRLDGIDALRALYDGIRGQVQLSRWEIVDPKVTVCGEMALLTFNFDSDGGGWNTTEVYIRRGAEWRILHSHWSVTKADMRSA